MATLEERVAYLEGRVGEHSKSLDGLREAVVQLERRIDVRFEAVDRRLDAFEQRVDARFEAVDRRFEGVERRLDSIEDKVSHQFVWLVGIQVTTLAAIVGALVTR